MLVELHLDAGRHLFGQTGAQFFDLRCSGDRVGRTETRSIHAGLCGRHARLSIRRRHEVNAIRVHLDDLRAASVQPVDHLLQKLAPDLGDARRRIEIGEMPLGEAEIAVKAVDQNLERILESVEIALPSRVARRCAHARLCFQPEGPQIGEQVAKNLQLIRHRKAVELQHDGRIKGGHVAMPDVARHSREEDGGVTALESAHHRHFRNGMTLPKILPQKERVDPGGVAPHDHVLVVVGKNLRLDEITRAEKIREGARFTHRAQSALAKPLFPCGIGPLQFPPAQSRHFLALAKPEMPRHIDAVKSGQGPHPDIIKLREQKGVDKMPAIDGELWIIDGLLRDLEPGRT